MSGSSKTGLAAAECNRLSGLGVVDGVFAPAMYRWLLGEARRFHANDDGFPDTYAFWHPDLQRGEQPVRVY